MRRGTGRGVRMRGGGVGRGRGVMRGRRRLEELEGGEGKRRG